MIQLHSLEVEGRWHGMCGMFSQNSQAKRARPLENIPPTKASLLQHVKRAVFQGGYIWDQTLLKQPTLLPPFRWVGNLRMSAGFLTEQHYRKPKTLVTNLFTVVVRLAVGDIVNAAELI